MKASADRLLKAKEVIQQIANGVNPLDQSEIPDDSFLHHPKIIRSLFCLLDYMDKEMNNSSSHSQPKPKTFMITAEQKSAVEFPDGPIGVNVLVKAINLVIDPTTSKKLNGAGLNKQLKKLGILSEEIDEKGKKRTIVNENSEGYGIIAQRRVFDGVEYDQVLFDEEGKAFVLQNIESLLNA